MPITRIAAWVLLLAVAGTALAGCGEQPPLGVRDAQRGATPAELIVLDVTLPAEVFNPGDPVTAIIEARNRSDRDIEIESPSAAVATLTVLGPRGETLARSPEVAAQAITPWTLPARQSRTWIREFTVGDDWPTGEPLLVVAELGARPGLRAERTFRVEAP